MDGTVDGVGTGTGSDVYGLGDRLVLGRFLGGVDEGIRFCASGRLAKLLGVSLNPGAGGTYVESCGGRILGGGGDLAGL